MQFLSTVENYTKFNKRTIAFELRRLGINVRWKIE